MRRSFVRACLICVTMTVATLIPLSFMIRKTFVCTEHSVQNIEHSHSVVCEVQESRLKLYFTLISAATRRV